MAKRGNENEKQKRKKRNEGNNVRAHKSLPIVLPYI